MNLSIGGRLRPEAGGKFAAAQVGCGITLSPFDAPLELVSILGLVLFDTGAKRNVGSNAVGDISQAERVPLRAVIVRVIPTLSFKVALRSRGICSAIHLVAQDRIETDRLQHANFCNLPSKFRLPEDGFENAACG